MAAKVGDDTIEYQLDGIYVGDPSEGLSVGGLAAKSDPVEAGIAQGLSSGMAASGMNVVQAANLGRFVAVAIKAYQVERAKK